ncbi:Peptide methionine sulfoxide reductase A2 [Abeliophyllum distichum]|uniref:peptide-methionine (S)-S-oxide reductase n=1 Tax=Abeliophyllum distichum TaxID=126358 RepID=A0ABD1PND4_9LAMI
MASNPALDPDLDVPDKPGLEFAQFAAGCFWGVELAFQRVEGVVKTEVGLTRLFALIQIFCPSSGAAMTPPPSIAREMMWGHSTRSGIYYYNETQAHLARESLEAKKNEYQNKKIVTEILPAKTFYRAEEYHQQYLEKGGGKGLTQSAAKGCNDPIRCYG